MKLRLSRLSLALLACLLGHCARSDLVEVRTFSWESHPISYSKPRLWNKKHLTWTVEGGARMKWQASTTALHEEIARSFRSWEAAGVFTFSQAAPGQKADITITFDPPPGRSWDGQLGTMGHASFPWAENRGHIYLDPSEWWSTQAFSVFGDPITHWLPHEIGHVLGLQHTRGLDHTMCAAGPYDLPDARSFARLRTLYAPGTPVIAWSRMSTASKSPTLGASKPLGAE